MSETPKHEARTVVRSLYEKQQKEMPNPTPEMLASPEFEAVWQAIKSWDVNVPEYYGGYCGATGSHVALILNALSPNKETDR